MTALASLPLTLLASASLMAAPIEGKPSVAEIMAAAPETAWRSLDPEDTLYLDLPGGRVVVLLVPELAPAHAVQIKTLAREGYFGGIPFGRVVEGFVAQAGDPSGEKPLGTAAPALAPEFEAVLPEGVAFTPLGHEDHYAPEAGFIEGLPAGRDLTSGTAWLTHCTGAFAFGREDAPGTAAAEIYLTLQPQRYLDRNLTVLGRAVYGTEHLQALPRGEFGNFGMMEDLSRAARIDGLHVAADLEEEARVPIQIMDTASESFAQLLEARAARPAGFFVHRPGHVDLCQMPVPVRLAPQTNPGEERAE